MRTSLRFIVSAAVLCATVSFAFASPGAQILTAVPDARSSALGRTYTAMASDVHAMYYNPAGLARVSTIEIPLARNNYISDIEQEYAGIAINLLNVRTTNVRDMGTLGVTYTTLESGDITARDDAGAVSGDFRLKDNLFVIGYGKSFYSSPSLGSFMLGASAKIYNQSLQNVESNGQAFDVGAQWKAPGKNIYAGLAVQNMGPGNKYTSENYSLPSSVALGLSGGIYDNACILGVDLRKPDNDSMYACVGAEYWYRHTLALRAGYNGATTEAGSGLSAGFGISLKSTDILFIYANEICLDYAFLPRGDLGASHRLVLTLKMGAR